MNYPEQTTNPNILIRAMSAEDFQLIAPYLERVLISQGQMLAEANQIIKFIYFPEGGIVSITATTPDDGKTEIGIVGRDGLTGTAVLLGTDRTPHDTFVQVNGSAAWRIGADDFRRVVAQSVTLQTLLLRYVQTFLVQSAHSTVSNAHHRIEARLARWLLMCHDRIDGDEIFITHEFLSMMIAAQRTGVTVSLHILEGAGIISSKRARVIILNREKLLDLAGDAYGAPEAEYRRLIGPMGRVTDASG
jgi:CRP-like cAMP-binding protein